MAEVAVSRRVTIVGVALAALVLLAGAGFYGWTRVARYLAFPEAAVVVEGAERMNGWYVFAPESEPGTGFVFYPGGLVDAAAYAPLMQRLRDGGVLAVITPMPLDLAVFGIDRAADVIAAFPRVESWVIGGHSLGGAMASEFVRRDPEGVDGLVLLASYPAAATDLSGLPIRAVSTYGTENGVTPPEEFEASLARLPAGTELVVIDGGNHAQFGHYGPQAGDGNARIDREEQQRQTAETVLTFVRALRSRGPVAGRCQAGRLRAAGLCGAERALRSRPTTTRILLGRNRSASSDTSVQSSVAYPDQDAIGTGTARRRRVHGSDGEGHRGSGAVGEELGGCDQSCARGGLQDDQGYPEHLHQGDAGRRRGQSDRAIQGQRQDLVPSREGPLISSPPCTAWRSPVRA